ncbi:hypothetical protein KXV35_006578 [Aspergillus fumigatus]|nr:hypothetical protein KXV35_006578 [Aspergillus fumigatus]
MSYYGERDTYYGGPPQPTYGRPPYDRPPYEQQQQQQPPYNRPPYDIPPQDSPSYNRPPYERPPYERPPPERSPSSFDPSRPRYEGPPYNSSSPAPSAQPPAIPPPPLPLGWVQEWEPNLRRAYFVETATGRSQWETPMQDSEHARGLSGPPPGVVWRVLRSSIVIQYDSVEAWRKHNGEIEQLTKDGFAAKGADKFTFFISTRSLPPIHTTSFVVPNDVTLEELKEVQFPEGVSVQLHQES